MRIDLVSMPWASFVMPSAALGALSAYVRREEPSFYMTCRSEHLVVAGNMGIDLYEAVCKQWKIGEMLYLALLYPQRAKGVREWFVERAPIDLGDDLQRPVREEIRGPTCSIIYRTFCETTSRLSLMRSHRPRMSSG